MSLRRLRREKDGTCDININRRIGNKLSCGFFKKWDKIVKLLFMKSRHLLKRFLNNSDLFTETSKRSRIIVDVDLGKNGKRLKMRVSLNTKVVCCARRSIYEEQ